MIDYGLHGIPWYGPEWTENFVACLNNLVGVKAHYTYSKLLDEEHVFIDTGEEQLIAEMGDEVKTFEDRIWIVKGAH